MRSALTEIDRKLEAVENILGYAFEDRGLLMQALCHKSYANERGWPLEDANERLEFLGDSVIELSVTHLLFEDFPDAQEGELTKLRASIVKGTALAKAAERMGLPEFIMLGKGEESTGGRKKRSIQADTYEAVVAALYLDGGFDIARGMVLSVLDFVIGETVEKGVGDFKSELQELSAKRYGSVPRYRITEEGPDHYKTFHATVRVGDRQFGPVPGGSKKESEQGVARVALKKLQKSKQGKSGMADTGGGAGRPGTPGGKADTGGGAGGPGTPGTPGGKADTGGGAGRPGTPGTPGTPGGSGKRGRQGKSGKAPKAGKTGKAGRVGSS